ncbi:alpha/beta hydrolase [Rhodococcus koreensis]
MPFLDSENGAAYYRHWAIPEPHAAVVLLHGRGEHSGLYHRFAADLNHRGIDVWGIDHLGHGHTGGPPESMCDLPRAAANAAGLISLVKANSPGLPLALVGHSLGGLTSTLVLGTHDLELDCVVLCGTPLHREEGHMAIHFPERPPTMSLDKAYLDAIEVDPLISHEPIDSFEIDRAYIAALEIADQSATSWSSPVLLINGEHDAIAPPEIAAQWVGRLPDAQHVVVHGAYHDVLNDVCHREVADLIANFIGTHVPALRLSGHR